jgi:hypothetical protein
VILPFLTKKVPSKKKKKMTSLAIMLANSRRNNFEKNLKKFEPFFGKSSMLANRRKPSLNLTRFQVPGGKVSPICVSIDFKCQSICPKTTGSEKAV